MGLVEGYLHILVYWYIWENNVADHYVIMCNETN